MLSLEDSFKTLKASKAERLKALEFVCQNPHYIQKLFDLAVTPSAARIHIYATWVWELYLLEEPRKLDLYWSSLLAKISAIHHPSMRRVHSKVIWLYLHHYRSYKTLPTVEKKKLVTTLLDWILTESKTAPLNFSIRILALFARESPKLRADLEEILRYSKRVFPKGVFPAIRMVFKD